VNLLSGAAVGKGQATMKDKIDQPRRENRNAENDSTRIEMRVFLEALDSYPEHFLANPGLTFEEHRSRLMASARDAPLSRSATAYAPSNGQEEGARQQRLNKSPLKSQQGPR
jgi:hypothetical protein